jgi:salicylate hydroxylase
MLPYLAQGANMALEDGATLGCLLGKIESKSQIPKVVRIYEELRTERVTKVREETFRHQEEFHLPDGQLQQSRDQLLARSFKPEHPQNLW